MTNVISLDKLIDANDRNLKSILKERKFTVDYFQREYHWGKKHIDQLIDDLITAFQEEYRDNDSLKDIANYNCYYMGPIVLCAKANGSFSIIDGQQRLTALTLLLIFLNNRTNREFSGQITELIYSESYGEKSFNIDVPERTACLDSLYNGKQYVVTDSDDESTKNMKDSYDYIAENFPNEDTLDNKALKSFIYWVIEKIILVEIIARTDENAYTIFETMNDRGLSLTPAEMLKGFLLSKYSDQALRTKVNLIWRNNSATLNSFDNDTEALFLQSWLRSQFAESIRPTKIGALNEDFEKIGTRYHDWFKSNYSKGKLGEATKNGIELFMTNNYNFYLLYFLKIKNAEKSLSTAGPLEHAYYINQCGIASSLRYQLMLSPLMPGDDEKTALKKIETVAFYLDNFVVRRSINFKNFGSSSIRYTMCMLTKELRNKPLSDLIIIIGKKIAELEYSFSTLESFRLHERNRPFIKYYLCRLASFLDEKCGEGRTFDKYYIHIDGTKDQQIEHIWGDDISQHGEEFTENEDFQNWRNNIGDLILLPEGYNQSYGKLLYSDKVRLYGNNNGALVKTLCRKFYENNPNLTSFIKDSECKHLFPHDEFNKKDVKERAILYQELSNEIWDYNSFIKKLASE